MIEIIEKTLGISLNEKKLKKAKIDPVLLGKLSVNLGNYFKNDFILPAKSKEKLRPYISLREGLGKKISHTYLIQSQNPIYFENAPFIIEETIKPFSLYAHEICLQNPLTYLLDYFYFNPHGSTIQIEAIRHILIELARLKPLIEQNIIHFSSDELFPGLNINDFEPNEPELKSIKACSSMKEDEIKFIVSSVFRALYEKYQLQDEVDLFFENTDFAQIYKCLLRHYSEKYTSHTIKDPINLNWLGKLSRIPTQNITIDDIFLIRKNEELFNEWRQLISAALRYMEDNKENFTDVDNEFIETLKEKFVTLDLRLIKKNSDNTIFKKIDPWISKASFGVLTGGLIGIATHDLTIGLRAFITAATPGLLDTGLSILNENRQKKAISNHLLIFDKQN